MKSLQSDNVRKRTDERIRFKPSPENNLFLDRMKMKNIDSSSLINLALDILKPRLHSINTTESAIVKTLLMKTVEENLEY